MVHVHLAEVSPGLCEMGSDREQNQTLVQEHQQLLISLKVQAPRYPASQSLSCESHNVSFGVKDMTAQSWNAALLPRPPHLAMSRTPCHCFTN